MASAVITSSLFDKQNLQMSDSSLLCNAEGVWVGVKVCRALRKREAPRNREGHPITTEQVVWVGWSFYQVVF